MRLSIRTLLMCCAISVVIAACSSTSSLKRTGDPTIDAVLTTADGLRGTPYCIGGITTECFDCSGFVRYCFNNANVGLPRTTTELFAFGSKIEHEDMVSGDLVFFNTSNAGVSHVGIYIGEEKFIHSSTSHGVMISTLLETYWNSRYLGCRRVVSR